jgi:hypothetical protein
MDGSSNPNRDSGSSRTRPGFIPLWMIVTGLWTVATIMRIQGVWVPQVGWSAVLCSVYFWLSLIIPPWLFATVMLAVKRTATTRRGADG